VADKKCRSIKIILKIGCYLPCIPSLLLSNN